VANLPTVGPAARQPGEVSRRFWDKAARDNAAWHVATGHTEESEQFFRQGADETDLFLDLCGVTIRPTDTVLEIGCGVGRMTRRLSELAEQVIAVDVSQEMINRCAGNISDRANVACLLVPGDGTLPEVADDAVQVVFSYITLQHVPSKQAQMLYLEESGRVLAAGGQLAIQIRGDSLSARLRDWLGHLGHVIQRRATLSRAWRGARLSDGDVRHALVPAGLDLEVRGYNRHRWVVGRKPPSHPDG
jgi:SAM-dependent methyltransferase